MQKLKFIATVRRTGGKKPVGAVFNKQLLEFEGKKVVVKIRESEEREDL